MQKFDENVNDPAEMLKQRTNHRTKKNKKRLIYAIEFLFGLIIGSLLSHFFF